MKKVFYISLMLLFILISNVNADLYQITTEGTAIAPTWNDDDTKIAFSYSYVGDIFNMVIPLELN